MLPDDGDDDAESDDTVVVEGNHYWRGVKVERGNGASAAEGTGRSGLVQRLLGRG